jgi:hypothetical protein
MPDRKVGVAVFVNDSGVGFLLADAIANLVYDRLAGRADAKAKYDEAIKALAARRVQIDARVAADAAGRAGRAWTLTLPRAAYAGKYENDAIGDFDVTLDGETLKISIGNLKSVAEPFTKPDSVRVELIPGQGELILFSVGAGSVTALEYDGNVFAKH